MEKARTAVAAAMANNLAHQINNPLQKLMQTVFLVGRGDAEWGVYAQQAMGNLARLTLFRITSRRYLADDNQPASSV